ncbi:calpain-2 catalytic subunit-like [Pararge aegeria]|uniref:calpain-2 catalytic subunit-like n=1 Tax=Pararge aegeria TaxID=116150 RepID=UPI0019D1F3BA|nr:calpain-2 catalytic subunit-like [Pararge aegeria]
MRKFMRARGQPAPHKHNGNSNGVGAGPPGAGTPGAGPPGAGTPGAGPAGDDQRSSVGRAALWEDAAFPAAAASLADRRLAQRTTWLRPHELCARPRFLGDAALDAALPVDRLEPDSDEQFAARWRVAVGEAGDEALCCAAAALALTPRLLERAAPPHSFRTGYTGRFRFRFWVFGEWREVAVDDRLPARGARLLASRGALPDDFTLPLLEKAYAKLHGGYARLRGGGAARALQALSGGVLQSFAPPRQPRAALLAVLQAAVPRCSLLVAWRGAGAGLRAQAYCVTGLARVRGAAGGALVRLRAPAGRGEWAGAWARGAEQWRALPAPARELLRRRAELPGHFWMSFADFASAFGRLELVHVGPDDWLVEPALHDKRPWRAVLARRHWRRGVTAGGPPGAPTAHANPHFHLQVPSAEGGKCHVVISVTQQYGVGADAAARARLLGIGFAVYELPPGAAPRRAALPPLRALDVTHSSRAREVVTFFTLPAGQYLVVPHAHRAHVEAAFLLRILTDEHTDVWEVNDDNAIIRDIAGEFAEEGRSLPGAVSAAIARVVADGAAELDAAALRARLRRGGRALGGASRELCGALVALRDPGVRGRVRAQDLAPLLARLALWRAALAGARCGRVSAYSLRALLWACGVSASNKVLECLVLRHARGAALSADACALALARLHLAHERYRSLDSKLKSNPLSLEEMILMTIYS